MNRDVTVILNVYKRTHRLEEQIQSINNQTIEPKEIMIWRNKSNSSIDDNLVNSYTYSNNNKNFGVWSRFAYALNAKTEWVCVFDDDTIPGKRWFENCFDTYDKFPGLLGTNGVLFGNSSYYPNGKAVNVGWHKGKNTKTVKVDIVGHSWFFHRDLLSYFFRDIKPIDHNDLVGEDIHFSHMLQKYSGGRYSTWVPPHPKDNRELWGSTMGWEYGGDSEALSNNNSNLNDMGKYLNFCYNDGFRFCYDEQTYDKINSFLNTCSEEQLTLATDERGVINV
jgi:hypothetical protein